MGAHSSQWTKGKPNGDRPVCAPAPFAPSEASKEAACAGLSVERWRLLICDASCVWRAVVARLPYPARVLLLRVRHLSSNNKCATIH